jgi:hypothetical protein
LTQTGPAPAFPAVPLLVRPRVLGVKSWGLLETKEPRRFPIEFEGPVLDTDTFEITIPAGYVVDDLPPPIRRVLCAAQSVLKVAVKAKAAQVVARCRKLPKCLGPHLAAPSLELAYVCFS